jgi:hypothetical protein
MVVKNLPEFILLPFVWFSDAYPCWQGWDQEEHVACCMQCMFPSSQLCHWSSPFKHSSRSSFGKHVVNCSLEMESKCDMLLKVLKLHWSWNIIWVIQILLLLRINLRGGGETCVREGPTRETRSAHCLTTVRRQGLRLTVSKLARVDHNNTCIMVLTLIVEFSQRKGRRRHGQAHPPCWQWCSARGCFKPLSFQLSRFTQPKSDFKCPKTFCQLWYSTKTLYQAGSALISQVLNSGTNQPGGNSSQPPCNGMSRPKFFASQLSPHITN